MGRRGDIFKQKENHLTNIYKRIPDFHQGMLQSRDNL